MCCTKSCCGRFVFWVGIVLIVLGLGSGLYGAFGVDREETWELGDTTFPSPTALFGWAALAVGGFTLVTGIFGALAGHYKLPCYTLPFQIFVFIVTILMLILAFIGLAASSQTDELKKATCENNGGEAITVDGVAYSSLQDYSRKMYGETIDKYMCTPVCPCDEKYKKLFTEATAGKGFEYVIDKYRPIDISKLSAAEREKLILVPKNVGGSKNEEVWDLESTKNKVTKIPLYWVRSGGVTSFNDCWAKGLEKYFKEFKKDGDTNQVLELMKFINKVEDSLTCAGVCSTPLFAVTLSIEDGPVKEDCVTSLLNTLDSLVAPAVVCLITFFVLFASCMGGCWLCCGNNGMDQVENIMDQRHARGQTIQQNQMYKGHDMQ